MQPDLRIADNEASFRKVNEAIEAGRHDRDRPATFVCECGALGCNQLLRMTIGEYEAIRSAPRRFVVVDGHEQPEVESVVERHERYTVVAKEGDAGERAEETDPRGGDDAGPA